MDREEGDADRGTRTERGTAGALVVPGRGCDQRAPAARAPIGEQGVQGETETQDAECTQNQAK